jgi:hypothetical protein
MDRKKEYGQYYTTRYEYILQSMNIPENVKCIIEPFCGSGHLLDFIVDKKKYEIECYDIDPKKEYIIPCDTITNPPSYSNKFILTNPPYLARNKTINKKLFDKYETNDLYKCFICEITRNICIGGIIIIPLNFWCSIRRVDVLLRKKFLEIYTCKIVNIFEQQVFDDTTSTICSIQFEKKDGNENNIDFMIYPINKIIRVNLNEQNNYTIGGEIYSLPLQHSYTITRLSRKNIQNRNTNILVKCLDDNKENQIGMTLVDDDKLFVDNTEKQSARSYATLVILPPIDIEKQKKIVELFNEFLLEKRIQYHSLFLSNYRESKDISRKRISFELVYQITEFLLEFHHI